MNRRGVFGRLVGVAALPACVASLPVPVNIDARGASEDAMRALPEILRRNNEALKADILAGFQRRKYRL